MDNHELMRDYAKRGWAVFPIHKPVGEGCSCCDPFCENIGKHPATGNGLKSATTSPATISTWAKGLNVGIATGAASGFFVIETDVKLNGDELWRELEQKHGAAPETVQQISGSGGTHMFFKMPTGCKVPNNVGTKFGPGIDIRGDGGYIVAPGSKHRNGKLYQWEVLHHPDDVQIAEAPQWILDRVVEKPTPLFLTELIRMKK